MARLANDGFKVHLTHASNQCRHRWTREANVSHFRGYIAVKAHDLQR